MRPSRGISVVLAVVLVASLGFVSPSVAQAQSLGVTLSPVVVIDTEKVFSATVLGRDIATRLEDRVKALAAENKRIASDLEAEERDLTEKRKTMSPEAFRPLADAFDEKVQGIRAKQDAKQRELQALRDAERQSFIEDIGPILSRVAADRGAVVVLDLRNVLLSAGTIDITDEAIRRINAATSHRPGTGGTSGGSADGAGDGAAESGPAGQPEAGSKLGAPAVDGTTPETTTPETTTPGPDAPAPRAGQ